MSNYATKFDLKNATHVNTSDFAWKDDLASLKSDVDKWKHASRYLSSLKSKLDKLDVDKFTFIPVNLSKLSDVVKHYAIKKTEYDELVRKDNVIGTLGFVKNTDYDSKINKVKGEMSSITALALTDTFNDVKNN